MGTAAAHVHIRAPPGPLTRHDAVDAHDPGQAQRQRAASCTREGRSAATLALCTSHSKRSPAAKQRWQGLGSPPQTTTRHAAQGVWIAGAGCVPRAATQSSTQSNNREAGTRTGAAGEVQGQAVQPLVLHEGPGDVPHVCRIRAPAAAGCGCFQWASWQLVRWQPAQRCDATWRSACRPWTGLSPWWTGLSPWWCPSLL